MALRIGVIADIHCGPDLDTLLGSRAPILVEAFLEAMSRFRPDCIVDLGDRLNSVAHSQDHVRTQWVRTRLREAGVPVYHVFGNTDIRALDKEAGMTALGKAAPYECVDAGGVRLMLLDTVDPAVERVGGAVGQAQLAWLAGAIEDRETPCVVCCHHPLDEPPLRGHRYFERHPDLATVRHRAEVRTALERTGRVRAVLAAHLHRTGAAQIEGIPYVTVGGLVESAYTGSEPCGAFALVTVAHERLDVEVGGLEPAHLSF